MHFVVYKDRTIDQFVSFNDAAQAIGTGSVGNNNSISLWLDNAGVLAEKVALSKDWKTFTGDVVPANFVNEVDVSSFVRPSLNLLDQPACTFIPQTRGWERYRLSQLEAAESLIDQIIIKLNLPQNRDTILGLSEIRCNKFAPGPQVTPWIQCLKGRVEQHRYVGGCARDTVMNVAISP